MPPARLLALPVLLAAALAAPSQALPPQVADCRGPAGDPAPGTQAYLDRDRQNMLCAGERLEDQFASPAFTFAFSAQTPGKYAGQNVAMLRDDTTDPHLTLGQLVPGGSTADPFRTKERWEGILKRGRVDEFSFRASNGAKLNGQLFRPPASVPGPYPGIVITTGSIQGYQEMYLWAAQGLAEAGYMVMTYDVQGQGNSGTFPAREQCGPTGCSGVPFQQAYNFFQGTVDALNWFLSSANPARRELDATRLGLAGHSLGASAVSTVAQCYPGIDAVVGWDNLAPPAQSCGANGVKGYPTGSPAAPTKTVPGLGLSAEYFFNPTPASTPPDPQAKLAGYQALADAGTDAMSATLRASTHLEWTYVPYILPASRLGERVSMYYTLAWFDRYVRGDKKAEERLTATAFDDSADRSSIGAGTFSPEAAAAKPTDPEAGNVPNRIAGLKVADRLSFYYRSAYRLGNGAKRTCADLRAGC